MNRITQTMRYRQSLIRYAKKHGVTAAAVKYKTYRQYVYRWMKRYDGTLESLCDISRRPHHHPNEHTEQELKLISDMRKRNADTGLVVFWVKLRQHTSIRHAAVPPIAITARHPDIFFKLERTDHLRANRLFVM